MKTFFTYVSTAYATALCKEALKERRAVIAASEDDADPYWNPMWERLGESNTDQEFNAVENNIIEHAEAMASKAYWDAINDARAHPFRWWLRRLLKNLKSALKDGNK
jgi:hypothetical protein